MPRTDSSPPNSPAKKRQRLSSPTYDDQLGDLSQEDLAAYDELEYRLSQPSQSLQRKPDSRGGQTLFPIHSHSVQEQRKPGLPDDSDNPFNVSISVSNHSNHTLHQPSSMSALAGFSTASGLCARKSLDFHDYERSPSPEAPPEKDFSAWFEPTTNTAPDAFRTSSLSHHAPIGFAKASNKGFIIPSTDAFVKAKVKMQSIWKEVDSENGTPVPSSDDRQQEPQNSDPSASKFLNFSLRRAALRAVENSPATPSPVTFSRPGSHASGSSPAINMFLKRHSKPFKSPLISKASSTLDFANRRDIKRPLFFTASLLQSQSHPIFPAGSFITPIHSSDNTSGATHGRGKASKPFITPFKAGSKRGPCDAQLEKSGKGVDPPALTIPLPRKVPQRMKNGLNAPATTLCQKTAFDLTRPQNRVSLKSSGLVPQQCSRAELESMGINIGEIAQITPTLALYYTFHASSSPVSDSHSVCNLGPKSVLEELSCKGYLRATKPWVDNHWCLILWKLAGMVAMDPERESTNEKRWCWEEVMRQFLYRYERELNCGKRPALRLISTQDVPAAYPMVLCISNIIWPTSDVVEDGITIESYPELEVTDGWYRLRAQVDAPLARAIKRGTIQTGRKIGVAGARLFTEKKEPCEVLEAYNSMRLIITGNSSHLVPWHAKLGFTGGPCISTLHSLTHDGGLVAAMDLVVVRVHPIAFLEFYEDENGKKRSRGPRNEKEEEVIQEAWKRKWEFEMSKLRQELEKRLNRYESYIARLERRAADKFNPGEDDFPPRGVEGIYDELEDGGDAPRVLSQLCESEAGWLARYIRERVIKERECAQEEMERKMKHLCPPREVRSFRVLIVGDACTQRRSANRRAQLTVWDVLNLSFVEGIAPGTFKVGERFMVNNLIPTQSGAWMNREPGSEVFLSTRRDSRWTPIETR